MREFLVPILGEGGAVVAQFLLTIIIVLGLIVAVWWFVRRYSGVHFGGIGRGRVPRLAVIDVMPVDRRRRLVLVRRDNVEHLILIGGPSDLVVEGTIVRTRQRSAQQAAQAAAQAAAQRAAAQPAMEPPPAAEPEAPPPETDDRPPANEPIPFPVARNPHPQGPSATARALLRSVRPPPPPPLPEPEPQAIAEPEPAAPSASFVEPQRPTQVRPIAGRPAAAVRPEPAPLPVAAEPHGAAAALFPEVMTAGAEPPPMAPPDEPAAPPPATFADAEREAAQEAGQSALDLGDCRRTSAATSRARCRARWKPPRLPPGRRKPYRPNPPPGSPTSSARWPAFSTRSPRAVRPDARTAEFRHFKPALPSQDCQRTVIVRTGSHRYIPRALQEDMRVIACRVRALTSTVRQTAKSS